MKVVNGLVLGIGFPQVLHFTPPEIGCTSISQPQSTGSERYLNPPALHDTYISAWLEPPSPSECDGGNLLHNFLFLSDVHCCVHKREVHIHSMCLCLVMIKITLISPLK